MQLGLDEVVSITVPADRRSAIAGDFDHRRAPDGSPMKRDVLHRIGRACWEQMGDRH